MHKVNGHLQPSLVSGGILVEQTRGFCENRGEKIRFYRNGAKNEIMEGVIAVESKTKVSLWL